MSDRKIVITEDDVQFEYSKSGGAGGQNVNKRNTQAVLYFRVSTSDMLTEEEKIILMCHGCSNTSNEALKKIWNRINASGDVIIKSGAKRTQEDNKREALNILNDEINAALKVSKPREVKLPKRVLAARKAKARQQKQHKYKKRKSLMN